MVAGRANYVENLKTLFPDDHAAIDKFMHILDVSTFTIVHTGVVHAVHAYFRCKFMHIQNVSSSCIIIDVSSSCISTMYEYF